MRFGSRDTTGLSPAQAGQRMNPLSLYLPTAVDIGTISGSFRASATATASATNHTKGPWTQITAATSAEASMVVMTITTAVAASANNTSTLVDIGIGGSGSEVVVVPNIPVGYLNVGAVLFIPVAVPAGSRVAFRAQSAVTSKQVAAHFDFWAFPVGAKPPAATVSYTPDTATSQGVTLTVPGGNNTKGAWTEVVASTTVPLQAMLVAAQCAGSANTANNFTVDIGLGAGGSEAVIPGFADIGFGVGSTEIITNLYGWFPIPCNIPAGQRLAARYQASNSAGNGIDIIAIGVPK
jgi:hypothetical protein